MKRSVPARLKPNPKEPMKKKPAKNPTRALKARIAQLETDLATVRASNVDLRTQRNELQNRETAIKAIFRDEGVVYGMTLVATGREGARANVIKNHFAGSIEQASPLLLLDAPKRKR